MWTVCVFKGEAAPALGFSAERAGSMQEEPLPITARGAPEAPGTHCFRISMFRLPGGTWHSSKATWVLFPICSSRTPMRMFFMASSRRILQGQYVWAGSQPDSKVETKSHELAVAAASRLALETSYLKYGICWQTGQHRASVLTGHQTPALSMTLRWDTQSPNCRGPRVMNLTITTLS